jgi:hypothetical protein
MSDDIPHWPKVDTPISMDHSSQVSLRPNWKCGENPGKRYAGTTCVLRCCVHYHDVPPLSSLAPSFWRLEHSITTSGLHDAWSLGLVHTSTMSPSLVLYSFGKVSSSQSALRFSQDGKHQNMHAMQGMVMRQCNCKITKRSCCWNYTWFGSVWGKQCKTHLLGLGSFKAQANMSSALLVLWEPLCRSLPFSFSFFWAHPS